MRNFPRFSGGECIISDLTKQRKQHGLNGQMHLADYPDLKQIACSPRFSCMEAMDLLPLTPQMHAESLS